MTQKLLERIEALPLRYATYKGILKAIAQQQKLTSPSQLRRALKRLATDYDERLAQLTAIASNTRIKTQLTQCRTITQKCHELARTKL